LLGQAQTVAIFDMETYGLFYDHAPAFRVSNLTMWTAAPYEKLGLSLSTRVVPGASVSCEKPVVNAEKTMMKVSSCFYNFGAGSVNTVTGSPIKIKNGGIVKSFYPYAWFLLVVIIIF
jgi:hypothetical protein